MCRGGSTTSATATAAAAAAETETCLDGTDVVLQEIAEASTSENGPLCCPSSVESAIKDFSPHSSDGHGAWKFLRGLASSPTFINRYWHKQPLLIKAHKDPTSTAWVAGSFTVEKDLKLTIDGSFIAGQKTAEILRNGTKTDTWEFRPIKDVPTRPTTWSEVREALQGGTIYFNTAGSLWPTLGGLCRLTNAAFGLPSNVNIYLTPPGVQTSVPPHTDRQDVLVFQTQGAKRWRVYRPPKRQAQKDPLNRGKAGDVMSFEEELGEPLLDAVLQEGDILYVPTGFPHTTDTCTVVADPQQQQEQLDEDAVFSDTSVHLTMGLDTHVWGLTMAHMRWSLLQRCGTEFNLRIQDDDSYWAAMETIPMGFLAPNSDSGDTSNNNSSNNNSVWIETLERLERGEGIGPELRQQVIQSLKDVMIQLEPDRWDTHGYASGDDNDKGSTLGVDSTPTKEKLPDDSKFAEVVNYMFEEHLMGLMAIQDEMFSNVEPHNEESLIKAFQCAQKQNQMMERFGGFSQNKAMEEAFAQRRMKQEEKVKEQSL